MSILTDVLLVISFLASILALKYFVFFDSGVLEDGFSSVFSSVLAFGLLSWALMRLNLYAITWIICGGFTIASLAIIGSMRRRGRQLDRKPPSEPANLSQIALFSIVLGGLGTLYALFPTYYLLGGRDPGIYLLLSQHIARTGGLHFTMPAFSEFSSVSISKAYPALFNAAARHLTSDPTILIPQFMHLFPSLGAIFYSATGLEGLVRANAVIAVLALWGVFMTGKRLMGYWPALATVLVLGINPAVIWNARITLTEALSVALFFGGLAFIWRSYDKTSAVWGFVAGSVLGAGVLDRIDGSLNVLVVLGVAVYATVCDRKYRGAALAAAAGYLLFSTIGHLDGYLNSYPYVDDLWRVGALKALVGVNYAAVIFAVLLLALPEKLYRRAHLTDDTLLMASITGVIALGAWLVFSFFIWPTFSGSFDAHASRELGWYTSPLAYPLFLGGLYLTMRERRIKYFLPLWLVAGATVFIFTLRPSITPDLIWASRRWVPYVIPMMMLFSVACLWRVTAFVRYRLPQAAPVAAGGCALALLYYGAHSYVVSEPFLFKSMLHDLPQQYTSLVKDIESAKWPKDAAKTFHQYHVFFSRTGWIASILNYWYDVPVVLVKGDYPVSHDNQRITNAPLVGGVKLMAEDKLLKSKQVCGQYLNVTTGKLPRQLYNRCYDGSIGVLSGYPWRGSRTVAVTNPNAGFLTVVGVVDKTRGVIQTRGATGFLLYGPYITLPAGDYFLTLRGWKSCTGEKGVCGHVEVRSHVFKKAFATAPLVDQGAGQHKNDVLKRLAFTLTSKTSGIEFRVFANAKAKMAITTVTLTKLK